MTTCGQNIVYGYPCPHILCVIFSFNMNIPHTNLIHQHWITTGKLPSFAIDSDSFVRLNNFDISELNPQRIERNQNEIEINIDKQNRYSKIAYLGKQLARIGSLASDSDYYDIIFQMSRLLSSKSLPVNAINEPAMAVPRKKGRKKKNQINNENNNREDLSGCRICKSKEHQAGNCSIYNYYIWRKNNPTGYKNKSKCKICGSRGHNSQTCDVRRGGLLGINDEAIFNYYGEIYPNNILDLISEKIAEQ